MAVKEHYFVNKGQGQSKHPKTNNSLLSSSTEEIKSGINLKNGVFWNVMPCGSCKNRRFGGT
jgi:hypothetical protein